MTYTIVPRPFQIYQNVTMTGLVQGQSSRLILTKTWNIDNLAIIFVICNLCKKSFPLVSVHDIDLQLWPSSRSYCENIDDWLTSSISHFKSISNNRINWFSWQSPAWQYGEVPYQEINYGLAKCGCPIVIGLSFHVSVCPFRKKWLSPFYST